MNTPPLSPSAVLPTVALIAGPTASGKSARALDMAGRHGGTIINADSAQVYRDLRVLTARPSADEERQLPHRLFGHVDAADSGYSAVRWAAEAKEAIAASLGERRLPILVGGTGLYLRTLLDGIAPVPPIDPAVRAEVRALPVADAHTQLSRIDPAAAARLHVNDTTRIARALEVIRSTGRALAAWQVDKAGGIRDTIDLAATVLLPPRAQLYADIDTRGATMLAGGAVEEVALLLGRSDLPASAPIRRTIGIIPLAGLLAGSLSRAEALARLQLDTRRYAKRQYTWFGNQPLSRASMT